ncbi:MAG: HU family DNA-binding protein [Anaerolineales bacterium]|nr:HU family DNA-binding protein [Anaerolineales bacterium]
MTVKFNIVERGNPSDREAPKKFYPAIRSSGRRSTYDLAVAASKRSTLNQTDMAAALACLLEIIPEELARGNVVELGDFGSFWLRTTCSGAETADDVRATQIETILPRFNPGKQFKKGLEQIEFERGTLISQPQED